MYRFYINNIDNDYHYGEMVRVFLPDDNFEVIGIHIDNPEDLILTGNSYLINSAASTDRNTIKRELCILLEGLSNHIPEWGILTGVKPLKIAFDLYRSSQSGDSVAEGLRSDYMLSDKKAGILKEILDYQLENIPSDPSESISLYVHIPFCPTRCTYCSFASDIADADKLTKYLDYLTREIEYMGRIYRENRKNIESVYIGGGTPTSLNADQIDTLIKKITQCFDINPEKIEFTIESGRPDTITADRLEIMRNNGVSRISINPQSLKNETMKLIGRDHTAQDVYDGYKLAKDYNFKIINADLIAGLPGEDLSDFINSLKSTIELGANNITVHTLSVKRGSRLREDDPEYYRRNAEIVSEMLDTAHELLKKAGFKPYYIYRQKHQIGALENIGYCKPGCHSIYNVRIMEEKQTIIGLGAGAIGKLYFPDEDRLERIANISNCEVYYERFDEILNRKNKYYGASCIV